jgi:NADH:ubiquinone oxidoreductase subunit 4 (subunit M)
VVVVSVFGVVLSAGYVLWTVARLPALMDRWSGLTDARWWEVVPMGAMVAAMFVVTFPAVLTDIIEPSVRPIVERL